MMFPPVRLCCDVGEHPRRRAVSALLLL